MQTLNATVTAADVDVHGAGAAGADHTAVHDVLPHSGHRQCRRDNHQPGLAFKILCVDRSCSDGTP